MAGTSGGFGGVEDRSCIEPDVAASGVAGVDAATGDKVGDFTFRHKAMAVGAGCDQEGRIVRVDRIEMHTQGQHSIK